SGRSGGLAHTFAVYQQFVVRCFAHKRVHLCRRRSGVNRRGTCGLLHPGLARHESQSVSGHQARVRKENVMGTFAQDVRYGLRMLIKAPSVSIVATIALALGIGANTAIFSVVNAVLLRPLPYPNSEALMSVFEMDQTRGLLRGSYSYPNFFDLRSQNHVFEHAAAYHDSDFILTGHGAPVRIQGAVATADLFSVVGIMPHGFEFPIQNEPVDLWSTISDEASGKTPITGQRGAHFLRVIARL